MEKNTKRRKHKHSLGLTIAHYIIYPFYMLYTLLRGLCYTIFYERIRVGDNGIIGPGFHVRYTERFSWGKLSFAIVILFIIVFLCFYLLN